MRAILALSAFWFGLPDGGAGPRSRAWAGLMFATAALCLFIAPDAASAQLISPGKLIESHVELDQIASCTKCHALGKRSVDQALCLDCHVALKNRLEAGAGYHSTLEETACATCHKDHFGREFDPIRFDTTGFDHDVVGFQLEASHSEVSCSGCHTDAHITAPDVRYYVGEGGRLDETYLGLDETCESCHRDDSRHGDQFSERLCATCHDVSEWAAAPKFRHEETGYSLTGRHATVSCVACHAPRRSENGTDPVNYGTITSTACTTCHSDTHEGSMGPTCTQCHSTSGWTTITSTGFEEGFDHGRTGFELRAAHSTLECRSCHDPRRADPEITLRFASVTGSRTYPRPESSSCASCHRDPHDGEFRGDQGLTTCTDCHGEDLWAPSSFDVIRHELDTDFPLTGAHTAVLCSSCHLQSAGDRPVTFLVAEPTCGSCHTDDDPHAAERDAVRSDLANCNNCHSTVAWRSEEVSFDHATTRFLLEGRHGEIACAGCHRNEASGAVRLLIPDMTCRSCHTTDDPHGGQFADRTCSSCHDARSFTMTSFDHSRTRFALDEVHARVACALCHGTEEFESGVTGIRFAPLGILCEDCHDG